MRTLVLALPLLLTAASVASGCAAQAPSAPGAKALPSGSADRGSIVFRRLCAACHGAAGDGKGQGAAYLDPEPRDFSRGVFRYRSTPTGSLPRDTDLARTVLTGLPDTAMPAFRDLLTAQEIADVLAHVKSFSRRFGSEEVEEPVVIPPPLPSAPASIERGRKVYASVQCGKCHGDSGKGDGWAKNDEMKDDLGRITPARDFTRGIYRSGKHKEDLYRAFSTGLDGSPMPGYEGTVSPEDTHHLVNFLLSLERSRGAWYWLSTSPRWYEPSEQKVRQ